MTAHTAGYSGTPLSKKLGIKEHTRLLALGAPTAYREWLEPLPGSVQFVARLGESVDIVHLFTARRAELAQVLARCREALAPQAAVWVSWPKKAARLPTDITEDTVREVALPLGFVDIKVCAVDDVWSGLKLVVRKELR